MKQYERLIAICISTVMVMAGQGVIGPVLPLYADSLGVSTAMVGATITAFGLARLVTNVPAGLLADRRGRRFLLVGGPLVTAIGMLGSGLADTIWVLLAFRFVAGLGSGLYMTGAQVYLLDIAGPDERGRFIAINQGALLVGVGFGPAVGGLIAGAYGLSAPFYVVAVGTFLTAIYGYIRLPETLMQAADDGDGSGIEKALSNRWELLRSRDFLAVGLVAFAVFSIRAGARQTLVPLQLSDAFDVEVTELGFLFTALGLVGLVLIWPAGWATDRIGRKALIVPTGLLNCLGISIVAFAGSLTIFVVGLGIAAVGSSISGPAPAAFVADLASEDQRGAAMGLYRTFGDVGIVLSPVLSGALADATSNQLAIGVNGALMGFAVIVFWIVATPDDRRTANR